MPVHVRRLGFDEADALVAFIHAAHERGDLASSSPWLGHGFLSGMVKPLEVAVAVDGDSDDAVVTFAGAILPEYKALVVLPERRMQGIGTRLVDAGLAIERERREPALFLGVGPGDPRGEGFLQATGFAFHSTVWDLVLPPDAPAPPIALPDGYTARPFARDRDTDAFVDAFNEAFADHPTPLQLDPISFPRWMDDPAFRDDDTILIDAPDGTLAAFAATDPRYRPDGSIVPKAEVWALGVRTGHRGRGLGRAALRLGVGWLRALGVEEVEIAVSGRNPTAIALYESEGFVRAGSRDRWSRPSGYEADGGLPPADGADAAA